MYRPVRLKNRSESSTYLTALIGGSTIGIGALVSPWLGLTLALGVSALIVVLIRPVTLCYLLIGATVLSSGMERGVLVPLLKPNEVLLVLAAAVVLLMGLADKKLTEKGRNYGWFSLLVLGIGTVALPMGSYLVRDITLTTRDWLTLVAPLQYFLLFFIFTNLPQSDYQRYNILFWMVVTGSLIALVGLLQAADVPLVVHVLNRYYPSSHGDVASEVGRVTSLMGAWNAAGIFLMVVLLIAWAVLPEPSTRKKRLTLISCFVVLLLGLVATGSFAGMGMLVVGIVLLSVLQRRGAGLLLFILASMLIALGAYVLLYSLIGPLIEQRLAYQFGGRHGQSGWIPQTLTFRFQVWSEFFWPAIRKQPIWGVHPTIPSDFGWHAMESQYIFLLFTSGVVGLCAWLSWWFGSCLWLLRQRNQTCNLARTTTTCTLVLMLVLATAGLTNEVFTFLGSVDYLWILLALSAGGATAQ